MEVSEPLCKFEHQGVSLDLEDQLLGSNLVDITFVPENGDLDVHFFNSFGNHLINGLVSARIKLNWRFFEKFFLHFSNVTIVQAHQVLLRVISSYVRELSVKHVIMQICVLLLAQTLELWRD